MKHLATIAALAVIVGASACSESSRSDPMITNNVKTELTDQHVPGNIAVTTDNGVVTLTGSVPDEQVKTRAEGVAKTASGVKYVVNDLRTTMAGDAPLPPPNLPPSAPGAIAPQNALPGGTNVPPNGPSE